MAGPWTLGRRYRWINPVAIVWVIIAMVILCLPFGPASVPWFDEFDAPAFNYTPMVLVVGALVAIWWAVSAKNKYTGPGADPRRGRGHDETDRRRRDR